MQVPENEMAPLSRQSKGVLIQGKEVQASAVGSPISVCYNQLVSAFRLLICIIGENGKIENVV
ncbi:hypothetical protein ACFFK0_22030 [Paenibacillus chartarius]|uniref:Uncharacterized protein n=1 Tax=Paenibacillus chartarius TaxID=747481 RepID=A0ABV6DR11_9BACL